MYKSVLGPFKTQKSSVLIVWWSTRGTSEMELICWLQNDEKHFRNGQVPKSCECHLSVQCTTRIHPNDILDCREEIAMENAWTAVNGYW
jgi:hypothetical protein